MFHVKHKISAKHHIFRLIIAVLVCFEKSDFEYIFLRLREKYGAIMHKIQYKQYPLKHNEIQNKLYNHNNIILENAEE